MKIGRNNSGLVVTLTETEHALLQHADFARVTFELDNKVNWIRLEKSDDAVGSHKLVPVNNDNQHSRRCELHGKNSPMEQRFGTEHVASRSPMNGILYGAMPTMLKPLTPMLKGKNRLSNPANMPGLEQLKEAVQIINNFRRLYGDQLEINLEGHELKIRMMLEI